jgi:hypothetical protein
MRGHEAPAPRRPVTSQQLEADHVFFPGFSGNNRVKFRSGSKIPRLFIFIQPLAPHFPVPVTGNSNTGEPGSKTDNQEITGNRLFDLA